MTRKDAAPERNQALFLSRQTSELNRVLIANGRVRSAATRRRLQGGDMSPHSPRYSRASLPHAFNSESLERWRPATSSCGRVARAPKKQDPSLLERRTIWRRMRPARLNRNFKSRLTQSLFGGDGSASATPTHRPATKKLRRHHHRTKAWSRAE